MVALLSIQSLYIVVHMSRVRGRAGVQHMTCVTSYDVALARGLRCGASCFFGSGSRAERGGARGGQTADSRARLWPNWGTGAPARTS